MAHRRTQRTFACALVLAGALLVVPAAGAQTGTDPDPDEGLWATVNVCDTAAQPDTIGIRGSMPGTGSGDDRMFMRFTVQYQGSDGVWRPLSTGGRSDWQAVGSGRWETRQSGFSFQVRPPAGSVRLRGLVRFEWRRGRKVVRSETRATEAGHRSTAGAQPRGYSRGVCTVTT